MVRLSMLRVGNLVVDAEDDNPKQQQSASPTPPASAFKTRTKSGDTLEMGGQFARIPRRGLSGGLDTVDKPTGRARGGLAVPRSPFASKVKKPVTLRSTSKDSLDSRNGAVSPMGPRTPNLAQCTWQVMEPDRAEDSPPPSRGYSSEQSTLPPPTSPSSSSSRPPSRGHSGSVSLPSPTASSWSSSAFQACLTRSSSPCSATSPLASQRGCNRSGNSTGMDVMPSISQRSRLSNIQNTACMTVVPSNESQMQVPQGDESMFRTVSELDREFAQIIGASANFAGAESWKNMTHEITPAEIASQHRQQTKERDAAAEERAEEEKSMELERRRLETKRTSELEDLRGLSQDAHRRSMSKVADDIHNKIANARRHSIWM